MTPLVRPGSILWFERLLLASIVIRPIYLIGRWEDLTLRAGQAFPVGLLIALAALTILIPLILGWLVARRASRVAAWLVEIWIVAGLLIYASSMVPMGLHWDMLMHPAFAIAVLSLAAGIALLLPESRRWLAGRPGFADLERDFS